MRASEDVPSRSGHSVHGLSRSRSRISVTSLASQAVLFVGLLDEHRRQLSSTGAAHANPFDLIRKPHHDLSGQNTKADPEVDLIVGLAESIISLTRWKHFLRSH